MGCYRQTGASVASLTGFVFTFIIIERCKVGFLGGEKNWLVE